ncbi:MAG: hypothetical protein IPN32_39190 [Deltaproteobacteria bacterium]|nr:hypothetical protein [Deltaproteobacteria bacterium]
MTTRALSSVRLDSHTTFRYVLFVEGLPWAWTDDESGSLTGSGLGSWIGTSETAIGGVEVLGTRSVRPGLVVPDSVRFEVEDLKSGLLLPAPASFTIVDPDLGSLFAIEHDSTIVTERIPPTTTALGTSIQVDGGGTTNPRGRYIGIERIGASGQRRSCPAIPYQLVGYDHPFGEGLPPLLISDEPIEHAGRMVTLYRIHADPTAPGLGGELDATSFYDWLTAHEAGDLVWWGILQDAGTVSGDEAWALDCHGPDALLRRTLGALNDPRWIRINAEPTLSAEQDQVAMMFLGRGVGAGADAIHDGSVFDHTFTGTDRNETTTELNTWIANAISGADTNWSSGNGPFTDLTDLPTGSLFPTAGVTTEGVIWIRRVPDDPGDAARYALMRLTMHERRWRMLGYQPETQGVIEELGDVTRVEFRKDTIGESLQGTGIVVPASGYWTGTFTTITPGYAHEDVAFYGQDGAQRRYYPIHTAEVFTIDRHGGQVLTLQEPPVYLEGQNTAGRFAASSISGVATTRAGWFAARGEVALSEDDVATDEFEIGDPVERHHVFQASWRDGTSYGAVGVGDGFEAALYLERFLDGRTFGFPDKPLTYDWAGKVAGKGGVEVARLNAYHYYLDDAPAEISGDVAPAGAAEHRRVRGIRRRDRCRRLDHRRSQHAQRRALVRGRLRDRGPRSRCAVPAGRLAERVAVGVRHGPRRLGRAAQSAAPGVHRQLPVDGPARIDHAPARHRVVAARQAVRRLPGRPAVARGRRARHHRERVRRRSADADHGAATADAARHGSDRPRGFSAQLGPRGALAAGHVPR